MLSALLEKAKALYSIAFTFNLPMRYCGCCYSPTPPSSHFNRICVASDLITDRALVVSLPLMKAKENATND